MPEYEWCTRNRTSHTSVKFSRVQSFHQLSNPLGKRLVFKASIVSNLQYEGQTGDTGPGMSRESIILGIWDRVVLSRVPLRHSADTPPLHHSTTPAGPQQFQEPNVTSFAFLCELLGAVFPEQIW